MSDVSKMITAFVVAICDRTAYSRSQIVTSISGEDSSTDFSHD
jgi:hypothetical protein